MTTTWTPNPGQQLILDTWYPTDTKGPPKLGIVAIGRQSGTTTLAAHIVVREAANFLAHWPQDFPDGQQPYFTVVVPTAHQVHYIRPAILQFIKELEEATTELDAGRDQFTLWAKDNPKRKVRIQIRAATAHTLRGCTFGGTVVFDSFAYYQDPEEMYYATRPQIATNPYARLLIMSTPPREPNFFNHLWWSTKENQTTLQIPTWTNPALGSQEHLKHLYCHFPPTLKGENTQAQRDNQFNVEYGGYTQRPPIR